jgi:hypothetical protein
LLEVNAREFRGRYSLFRHAIRRVPESENEG